MANANLTVKISHEQIKRAVEEALPELAELRAAAARVWGLADPADRDARFTEAVAKVTPCTCSAQRSRAERAEAERDELRATVERVRAIHEPIDAVMNPGPRERIVNACIGCGTDDGNWQRWPCPTVRALSGAGESDGE